MSRDLSLRCCVLDLTDNHDNSRCEVNMPVIYQHRPKDGELRAS